MTMRQSRLQGKFSLLIKFRQGQNREISHTGKQIQRGAGWVSRVRKTGMQGQNRQIRQKQDKECWRAWQKHTRQSGREQAEVDQCTCGGTNEGMGCRWGDGQGNPGEGNELIAWQEGVVLWQYAILCYINLLIAWAKVIILLVGLFLSFSKNSDYYKLEMFMLSSLFTSLNCIKEETVVSRN